MREGLRTRLYPLYAYVYCVHKVDRGHTNIVHELANMESTFHTMKCFFGLVHALYCTLLVWCELAKGVPETFYGAKLQ